MDAEREYRRLAGNEAVLRAVEETERLILRQMAAEGYSQNRLNAALFVSRYLLVTADKEGAEDYFARIMADGADKEAQGLPSPVARFNELYEAHMADIKDALFQNDKEILAEMQQSLALEDVREAYLGGSLYRDLCGSDKRATPYEQELWRTYRKEREDEAAEEAHTLESLFEKHWQERSQREETPLAYREGEASREFLRDSGAKEETLRSLLEERTEYDGRDKTAYVRKLAAEALREKTAYENLKEPAEENNFAMALCALVKGRDGRAVRFLDEKRLARLCLAHGMEAAVLENLLLAASPTLQRAGLDHRKALASLLGETDAVPFFQGDYATLKDSYKRILVDYDEALVQEGKGRSVHEERSYYNKLAVREMLDSGASEEEIQDVLEEIGGIPEKERTRENLSKILAEAREAKEAAQDIPTPEEAAASIEEKARKKEENAPVRKAWEAPQEERKEDQEEEQPHLTARDIRRERARVKVFELQIEREDGMEADEMYARCAREYKKDFQIPFNDAMDEQIILYMFNQGYEEREIESAVQRLSEAPSNHRQTQYAKRKMTGMKKDPRHAAVLGANAQKIQNAENNYLQTKYQEGKSLTEHDRALVRKRDTVGVPQR